MEIFAGCKLLIISANSLSFNLNSGYIQTIYECCSCPIIVQSLPRPSSSSKYSWKFSLLYHLSVIPGNEGLIATGSWCPQRDELATQHQAESTDVISSADSEFVEFFGEATPHLKGERRNIFGNEDELKTAGKGVDKEHK